MVSAVVVAVAVAVAVAVLGDGGGGGDGAGVDGAEAGRTGGDFHSLVADPTTPGRLFAGGHEAVAVSADDGRTWQPVTSLENADAMGWAFTDEAVYVSGHPGLNRSTDGARTFARTNEGLPDTDVHAFGAGRAVLYGATPRAGVFASVDGGRTWTVRTNRTGPSFFGRIVVDPGDDEHLFAADAAAGVVESRDGGRSWRRLDAGLAAATWLSGGPGLDVLVASGPAGAATSRDRGATWTHLDLPAGASLVETSPIDPGVLYAGIHQGGAVRVRVSRDGGRTWSLP